MASRSRPPSPRTQHADTWWAQLSPTARHGACLGLLLLVAAAFYAPVLLDGKTIHGGDVVSWRANAEALIEHQKQTGERVLWAPNVFSGMPAFLINYKLVVPQLDTVVNALRGAMWPIEHVFLLMAGVYVLMVYLRRDAWAGLVAAVGFGFTTYLPIILGAGHQTKFVALSFAPFLLLAFAYTLRNPSLLGGLLFAGALSLKLRAKHPQITYYVMMVLFVWWIVELVGAVRDDTTGPFAKATGWLAGGTGLGLLMVAQPYLATYQYKQFSTRAAEAAAGGAGGGGGGAMSWDYAMRWSQGIAESITLVVADAFGGGQNYWGPKPFTEGPHYVGGVIVALAGLALWKVRSRAVWGLGAAAGATLLFAFGRHASWINRPMFDFFPFFDAFRAPETWLSITALVLAVLAGFGLDYALRREPARGRKRQAPDARLRPIIIAFGVAVGLVALLWGTRDTLFDFEQPNEEQRIVQAIQRQNPNLSAQNQRVQRAVQQEIQRRKGQRRADFSTDAQRTLFFLVGAGLALVLYRRETIPGWLAGVIVVGLVTIDLWSVDTRYLGSDDYSEGGGAEQEIPTYAFDQFILQQRKQAGGPGHFRVLPLAEGNPTNTARPSYHYEQVGGYHGAKLQRYQDYLDHILQINQGGAPNENALDLMNTRYIVARQPLPGTQVVHRSEQSGVLVLENPDAVPRAFFVGQTKVVEKAQATWQRLRSADFDPRTTALLPQPLDEPITPLDSTSTARVELQRHTPAEIEWTVETDAPRLLVASEVYYPAGWTASLDGEPVPIHRVNYLLRGVHVPAGEHELVMRFEPSADRIGTWIAAVATAVDYGGILWIVGVPYVRRRFLQEATGDDANGAGDAA